MKSKIQQRFREHLMEKGKLPKMEDESKMFSSGGMVDDDDMGVSDDMEWNEHDDDSSGEPSEFNTANGFAFGGEIVAPEHGSEDDQISDTEVSHYLAKALMRRKQLPGVSR